MRDAVFYPVIALLAAGLIALGLQWPQGQGARSPSPFGHALAPLPQPLAPPRAAKPSPAALRGREPAPSTTHAANAAVRS